MTDIKLYRINFPFVVGYNLEINVVCVIYSHHNCEFIWIIYYSGNQLLCYGIIWAL